MKKIMILACAVASCPKCGQQAGCAACCKAGAAKCAKCGLDAGSPGCKAKCCPKAEAAK